MKELLIVEKRALCTFHLSSAESITLTSDKSDSFAQNHSSLPNCTKRASVGAGEDETFSETSLQSHVPQIRLLSEAASVSSLSQSSMDKNLYHGAIGSERKQKKMQTLNTYSHSRTNSSPIGGCNGSSDYPIPLTRINEPSAFADGREQFLSFHWPTTSANSNHSLDNGEITVENAFTRLGFSGSNFGKPSIWDDGAFDSYSFQQSKLGTLPAKSITPPSIDECLTKDDKRESHSVINAVSITSTEIISDDLFQKHFSPLCPSKKLDLTKRMCNSLTFQQKKSLHSFLSRAISSESHQHRSYSWIATPGNDSDGKQFAMEREDSSDQRSFNPNIQIEVSPENSLSQSYSAEMTRADIFFGKYLHHHC